jgi:hypothetical protein
MFGIILEQFYPELLKEYRVAEANSKTGNHGKELEGKKMTATRPGRSRKGRAGRSCCVLNINIRPLTSGPKSGKEWLRGKFRQGI